MAFDYKKEYKALYQPPCTPHLITVPSMTFALRNRISNMGMFPHMPRDPAAALERVVQPGIECPDIEIPHFGRDPVGDDGAPDVGVAPDELG